MKNISNIRKKIISQFYDYHLKNKNNYDFINSPYSYPSTWSKNSGYHILKSFYKYNNLEKLKQFLKELIGIGRLKSYKLNSHSSLKKKKFENLYITWARKIDFDEKGNLKNNYLPLFTKSKNLLFILNIDNQKIKNKNYFIWQKSNFKYYDHSFLIKKIISSLLDHKFKFKNLFYSINVDTVFSNLIYKELDNIITKYKIKKIFLPYEAQPFQKNLILQIRKKNRKVKFISFLNAVQPFPIHLHNYSDLSDKCYTISPAQKLQLTKIFQWDKKKLLLIKSKKFNQKNILKYRNKIILPFYITNFDKILFLIENLFQIKPKNYFSEFQILPHPAGILDENYKKFVQKIKILIKKYKYKFSKSNYNRKCIIVGSTSTITEALEFKLMVYHLVDQPELESLDNFFWPTVQVKQITDNIFNYTIKKTKTLINY